MKLNSILLIIVIILLYGVPAVADNATLKSKDQSIKRYSVMATKPALQLPGDTKALSFEFNRAEEMLASLQEDGKFKAEAWVKHNRLRCGTYQLGMRFGKGEHACVNVEWLTDAIYVTRQRQCNQVKLHHKGYGEIPAVKDDFSEITCGQLIIKCTGACD